MVLPLDRGVSAPYAPHSELSQSSRPSAAGKQPCPLARVGTLVIGACITHSMPALHASVLAAVDNINLAALCLLQAGAFMRSCTVGASPH